VRITTKRWAEFPCPRLSSVPTFALAHLNAALIPGQREERDDRPAAQLHLKQARRQVPIRTYAAKRPQHLQQLSVSKVSYKKTLGLAGPFQKNVRSPLLGGFLFLFSEVALTGG